MKLEKAASVLILFTCFGQSFGQKQNASLHRVEVMTPKKPIVCYSVAGDANTFVPPPANYLAWKKNKGGRTKTATIIVTYTGFSQQAKDAFQAAVDIWQTLIVSPVPIRISANWTSLATNVLGSASPSNYYRNFEGAQKVGVWYPIALAEKIARQELNATTDPDIVASFNSDNTSWSFDTQGATTPGKYDMVSVVLHEIGHGLGITHAYEVSGTNGQVQDFFNSDPTIYETFIENQSATNLVTGFASPSTALGTQLTSDNLFFKSPLVLAGNLNQTGKIYAPSTYSAGSSIAHLDESTYPKGDRNSLMTPNFNSAEAIHNPGPIAMGILKDMGWNEVFIQHTPIKSTENINIDFPVLVQIKNDTAYDASSVKLSYTSDGTTFTTKSMTATTNPGEFQSVIPKTGSIVTYGYYISVTDNAQRTFLNPGKQYTQGTSTTKQTLNTFVAGPDTKAPTITHSPTSFIKNTETQLKLSAIVRDNISLQKVEVQYAVNNVLYPTELMTNSKDSTYDAAITLPAGLVQGDKIQYRITATDNAATANVTAVPSATDYYTVNVVSLAAVQDFYTNNFDAATTDFFGDQQFSITTPAGFSNGAIHSIHPYPNGTGSNFESNYVYQLRVPVKLKASNATLKFDEIVLAEPSDVGAAFGSANFYDYVIVEGSSDGGTTWKPFADGWDSRLQSAWLAKWNSSFDTQTQPNSTAVGVPSLFASHSIDMLANKNFAAGDQVLIRFRLFADQLVHGWGWAIDNLKVQIDDVPPLILHNQVDFLASNATALSLQTKVTDGGGLKDLTIEYSFNNGTVASLPQTITAGTSLYNISLALSGLTTGNDIQYRIKATDLAGNASVLPASGFFNVSLLDFASTLTTYVSDFNSTNTDFTGNFFSVTKPTGFNDAAIHSSHPYLNGFGLDNTSSFHYLLKKPVVVDATNSLISFDEIVLMEYTGTSVKDYVVVEGSKDKGATWQPLLDPYSSNASQQWASAFDAHSSGVPGLFKNRLVDITGTGKFKSGDAVLIRFTMKADSTTNGWGWAIDNLSIQGPITGLEKTVSESFQVYPNPVHSDYLTVKLPPSFGDAAVSIVSSQGQTMSVSTVEETVEPQKIYVGNIVNGFYLVRIHSSAGTLTKKIIIDR